MNVELLVVVRPDPRDDLGGTDVQRKVTILGRELGLKIELEDVPVVNSEGRWKQLSIRIYTVGLFENQGAIMCIYLIYIYNIYNIYIY